MIINYFRLLPQNVSQNSYHPIILRVLCNPNINGETIIAAIRYFGTQKYDDAYESLLEYLETDIKHVKEYNFAAVAAKALSNYNTQRTIDSLIKQLANGDWYVRFNSADSLSRLNVDYEAVLQRSDDRFAREILIHRSEIHRLRRGEKFVL